ncbi:unnamed protein product [Clonostachys solani]|uniref:Uncharacterized protein n=1 Tax=Clonostachys solani TaxID=160281 RepID=A0A9P0E830_9HYPO|nr:unnamed protein product [Clonostachys solani]
MPEGQSLGACSAGACATLQGATQRLLKAVTKHTPEPLDCQHLVRLTLDIELSEQVSEHT